MLEMEIHDAIATCDGERLNEIVDEFRCGRDVNEIVPLLDSTNSEILSIGVWILCELPSKLYGNYIFLSRLRKLTEHGAPEVRFNAIGAIFPWLDWQDGSTRELLLKLRQDPNVGVRGAAEAAIAQLAPREA